MPDRKPQKIEKIKRFAMIIVITIIALSTVLAFMPGLFIDPDAGAVPTHNTPLP